MKLVLSLSIFLLFSETVLGQNEKAFELYGSGVRAFYAQDYQAALQNYSDALAIKPDMVPALFNRGLTQLKLNNAKAAKADFLRITELDSTYVDAYYQLGKMRLDEKENEAAFILFKKALKASPNHAKSLHGIGVLLYYTHQYKEAVDCYSHLLQLDAKDEQAYYMRALVEVNQSNYEAAIKDFSKTYELNPDNLVALEQRADSEQKANELDAACKDWKILLTKNNPRAQAGIDKYCSGKTK